VNAELPAILWRGACDVGKHCIFGYGNNIMIIIMGRKRIGQGRVTKECLLRGHVRYG